MSEQNKNGENMSQMDQYLTALSSNADFVSSLEEKKLTPAELKKREEIAQAIERENPDMPMGKKMAIATAQAKKVAEENIDEKCNRSKMEEEGEPESAKEKELAAMGHPKDKITKKDVLIARGVIAKEEAELTLEDFTIEDIEEYMMSEDYEQLDELSKNTLASYIKKASHSAAVHRSIASGYFDQGWGKRGPKKGVDAEYARKRASARYADSAKRLANVGKAADKLAKEEVEQIDEISKETLASYIKKVPNDVSMHGADYGRNTGLDNQSIDARKKAVNKIVNRRVGVERAVNRLSKEETELDEISKETLGSYIRKAALDISKNDVKHARGSDPKERIDAMNKGTKRYLGLSRAVDKLAKEEVELDEAMTPMQKLRDALDRHTEKAIAANKAGDHEAVKVHQGYMNKIKTKMGKLAKNEEVDLQEMEELCEISKSTLGSYVKKAANDVTKREVRIDRAMDASGSNYNEPSMQKALNKNAKRVAGLNKAVDKLAKEEVEELDELTKKTLANYSQKAAHDVGNKMYSAGSHGAEAAAQREKNNPYTAAFHDKFRDSLHSKALTRLQGIKTAAKKLAKEEVEQIDEVSKDTLHSYINKAAFDTASNAHQVAKAGADIGEIQKPLDKLNKRLRGIDKAAGKLAKEEVQESALDTLPKHKVAVTVSKDGNKSEKRVIVKALGRDDAKTKAEDFYKKQGYKVHDVNYHSKMANASMATEETQLNEASPTAGTRLVKKYGEGQKYHAEVRHDSQYGDYQVHYYKDGKHMGEGPVSHHYEDKEDAHDTAKHEVHRMNSTQKEETEAEKAAKELKLKLTKWKNQQRAAKALKEAHEVHVSDGSKYDEEPHEDDVKHVTDGLKKHDGEFSGHSDKGTFFKFKSHSDAENFRRHVNSCPKRTCSAEHLDESVNEAVDKEHPIYKEYEGLKKHNIKDLRGIIKRQHRIVDTSEFRTKEHAISHILHNKHGASRMKAVFGESVEQIDELSNDTLDRYLGKAHQSNMDTKYDLAHSQGNKGTDAERAAMKAKIQKRTKGMTTAIGKMMQKQDAMRKEDVDQVDEAVTADTLKKHPMYHVNDMKYLSDKGYKPHEIKKIWDRDHAQGKKPVTVNKNDPSTFKTESVEEAEQIDEISKQTLGSYVKKASFDRGLAGMEVGALGAKSSLERMKKRQAGIVKATNKLTKEEVEQIDEVSKDTLTSYVHKSFAAGNELHKQIDKETDPAKKAALKAELSKRNTGVIKAASKIKEETEIDLEQLEEGMISYNDFKSKIAAHRAAGNKVVDDKYHHSKEKAEYTVIDKEGVGRKTTHTASGQKVENLGKVGGHEDDEQETTASADKRGRGRPAGSKSGARRHN